MTTAEPANTAHRRIWIWAAQAVLGVVVLWFVWRSVADQLADFSLLDLPLEVRWHRIAAAAGVVWLTYLMLISAWRAILLGWEQHLPLPTATHIWCVSNLGRYLPGKLWSVAGLAVLAKREGVEGWAAAASALAMQALSLGTGAAVAVAFLPQARSPLEFIAAIAVAAAGVVVLTLKPMVRLLARLADGKIPLRPLPPLAVGLGAAATLVAWLMYGLAFRLLALGILPDSAPSFALAMGAFAGAYIIGLIAIFAPGGIGMREGMLLAFLSPTIGAGPALALSVASRLLLTFTEVVAALAALPFGRRKGDSV